MLTKAQKETLQLMRDKRAYIYHSNYGYGYDLMRPSDDNQVYNADKIKNIRSQWMVELSPFFKEEYNPNYRAKHYYLKEDAEITDEWIEAEKTRIAKEKTDKEVVIEAEKERLNKVANDYFDVGEGPYQINFDGQWPFNGSILFNGVKIASIGAIHYSTQDNTFNDMLRREENIPHFEAIKEMVRRANKND